MYQAINAIYQHGSIVPLEPVALDENEPVIVLRLKPMTLDRRKDHSGSARGAMKGLLSSVDEFIARKAEEKTLEDQ